MSKTAVGNLWELLTAHHTSELFRQLNVLRCSTGLRAPLDLPSEELAKFVLILAKAVDFGFDGHRWLKSLLADIPVGQRAALSVPGTSSVDLAEGILAKRNHDFERATKLFVNARIHSELLPPELIVYSWLGTANILRKLGRYKDAKEPESEARKAARAAGLIPMEADSKALAAWLTFKTGDYVAAESLYQEAIPVLSAAGDDRRCGDILSGLGRIQQVRGAFDHSFFLDALSQYAGCPTRVPNECRTLIVAAKGEWLRARPLCRKLKVLTKRFDSIKNRQDLGPKLDRQIRDSVATERLLRQEIDGCWERAHRFLSQARDLKPNRYRALRLRYISGYLLAEQGKPDEAAIQADKLQVRASGRSPIWGTRARVQQAAFRVLAVRERCFPPQKVGDEIARALAYAADAIRLSKAVQDPRIAVQALTSYVDAALLDPNANLEELEERLKEAERLHCPMLGDYLTDNVAKARRQLNDMRAASGDQFLVVLASSTPPDETMASLLTRVARLIVLRALKKNKGNVTKVGRELKLSPRVIRALRDGKSVAVTLAPRFEEIASAQPDIPQPSENPVLAVEKVVGGTGPENGG